MVDAELLLIVAAVIVVLRVAVVCVMRDGGCGVWAGCEGMVCVDAGWSVVRVK